MKAYAVFFNGELCTEMPAVNGLDVLEIYESRGLAQQAIDLSEEPNVYEIKEVTISW